MSGFRDPTSVGLYRTPDYSSILVSIEQYALQVVSMTSINPVYENFPNRKVVKDSSFGRW